MRPCVYILASGRNGTLYVGVTNHIARRAWEHRSDAVEGSQSDMAPTVWSMWNSTQRCLPRSYARSSSSSGNAPEN
jgi:putative endonuclease